jgi:hypothetical protein
MEAQSVGGLIGVLIGNVVFAIIGTALKGILRPISLAALIAAALYIGSDKIGATLNAVDRNGTTTPSPTNTSVAQAPGSAPSESVQPPDQSSVSPTIAPSESVQPPDQSSASPTTSPTAITGWSNISSRLNPALSKTVFAKTPATSNSNQSVFAPSPEPSSNPNIAERQPAVTADPSPISGLW